MASVEKALRTRLRSRSAVSRVVTGSFSVRSIALASAPGFPGVINCAVSATEDFRNPSDARRHHRQAGGSRLQNDIRQRFRAGRNHQQAAERECRACRHRSDKPDRCRQAGVPPPWPRTPIDQRLRRRWSRSRMASVVATIAIASIRTSTPLSNRNSPTNSRSVAAASGITGSNSAGDHTIVNHPAQRRAADLRRKGRPPVVALEQEEVGASHQQPLERQIEEPGLASSTGSADCHRAACRRGSDCAHRRGGRRRRLLRRGHGARRHRDSAARLATSAVAFRSPTPM